MYGGDRSRKEQLVEFGFRLPTALDNRPLTFDEFERHINQAVYVSATPADYEIIHTKEGGAQVVEQVIRPTGLLDPVIAVRPTDGQIDDLLEEVRARVSKGQRALMTTLTKRMAEDLTDYLKEMGVKTQYLHHDIETLERVEILRVLRLGVYDVVVGINLLREGLDLPEVSLVAILDADKEGFLRSNRSLIQTIGRAARHVEGLVIMYADRETDSMKCAISETERRRAIQEAYNDGARHHAARHHQEHPRPHRPRQGGGGGEGPRLRGRPDRRCAEGRTDAHGQGFGIADEGRRQEPRVREGRPPARSGRRTAPPAHRITRAGEND